MAALIPALICGGMMVGCVLMMSRKHREGTDRDVDADEVARLRAEVARLRAEHEERLPPR